ncbi:MAG: Hpt domain-containing protein [Roseicyclus sp.]|uniref:Hpt domain-containing protein n=1 Tax=Roseicyclus amphidinii TaxID=3034232 RepID=UPI0024E04E49|nr:Hpt domain-containing protein [Roseicyclus sp. Amp-Y-6]
MGEGDKSNYRGGVLQRFVNIRRTSVKAQLEETTAMIDRHRLNALREDIGEEDFADVVCLFIGEIGEKLTQLQAAPQGATADDFHFLRGSAVNLGLTAFAEACTGAEGACRAGQPPDVAGVARAFAAAMAALAPDLPDVAALADFASAA